jgi:hypothetical protein
MDEMDPMRTIEFGKPNGIPYKMVYETRMIELI